MVSSASDGDVAAAGAHGQDGMRVERPCAPQSAFVNDAGLVGIDETKAILLPRVFVDPTHGRDVSDLSALPRRYRRERQRPVKGSTAALAVFAPQDWGVAGGVPDPEVRAPRPGVPGRTTRKNLLAIHQVGDGGVLLRVLAFRD